MAVRIFAGATAVAIGLAASGAAAGPKYEWLRLDSYHVKWGVPAAGTGTVVSYALATGPVHSANARNCRDIDSLSPLQTRSKIPDSALEAEVKAAFAMWQAVANVRFRRAADPADADILIGAQAKPTGVAYADVAYGDAAGRVGMRSIRRSLICLNPERRWTIGFDGDRETYDLRYALAHEIGHAIGLDHAGPSGQLMSFRYEERFRELQAGDVAGVVGLYGARGGVVAAGAAARPEAAAVEDQSAGCPADVSPAAGTTALAPVGTGC